MRGLALRLRAGTLGGALVFVAGAVAAVLTAWLVVSADPARDIENVLVPSARPSAAATPHGGAVNPSPGPTAGAGARRLIADFDMLPTGTRIEGWAVSAGGRLVTAARPTAVDRSALLHGDGRATACQDLNVELDGLDATFMVDGQARGEETLLALVLDGESTLRLTLTDRTGMRLAGGQHVELDPGSWYRWVLASGSEGYDERLLAASDGTVLAEGMVRAEPNARATEFCMTAPPATRLYLTDLTVETR